MIVFQYPRIMTVTGPLSSTTSGFGFHEHLLANTVREIEAGSAERHRRR